LPPPVTTGLRTAFVPRINRIRSGPVGQDLGPDAEWDVDREAISTTSHGKLQLMTADRIIETLGLQPHPEGGHYRQTWVAGE
jgi:hypothetical protein